MDSNVTILIGRATFLSPKFEDGEKLEPLCYKVEELTEAPEVQIVQEFPNAEHWINQNKCILPYSHWVSMAKNLGAIYEALLNPTIGLMRDRGVFCIGGTHISLIGQAVKFYEEHNIRRPVRLLPGFEGRSVYDVPSQRVIREDIGVYDTTLASLLWLYNWMLYTMDDSTGIPAVEVR